MGHVSLLSQCRANSYSFAGTLRARLASVLQVALVLLLALLLANGGLSFTSEAAIASKSSTANRPQNRPVTGTGLTPQTQTHKGQPMASGAGYAMMGAGGMLVYAGIRRYSILKATQNVIRGLPPSAGTSAPKCR